MLQQLTSNNGCVRIHAAPHLKVSGCQLMNPKALHLVVLTVAIRTGFNFGRTVKMFIAICVYGIQIQHTYFWELFIKAWSSSSWPVCCDIEHVLLVQA